MKTISCLSVLVALLMTGIDTPAQTSSKKILVAYFSHSGNTREIANLIKNATQADIFEIQPEKSYPTEYNALVNQGKQEIKSGYKPSLKTKPENINQYDVIFIGSPCWWSTIAPPVSSFLSNYNLSGKTIIPFMTHGGSGLGNSVADIKKLCSQSTVTEGHAFWGKDAKNAQKEVTDWVNKIKEIK